MDQPLFVVEAFLGRADGISGLCARCMSVWARVRAPVCILLQKRVRLGGNLFLPEGSCIAACLRESWSREVELGWGPALGDPRELGIGLKPAL